MTSGVVPGMFALVVSGLDEEDDDEEEDDDDDEEEEEAPPLRIKGVSPFVLVLIDNRVPVKCGR